ncbi:MAG: DNRLRE domain-containing protein [Chloroflexota bacterium]
MKVIGRLSTILFLIALLFLFLSAATVGADFQAASTISSTDSVYIDPGNGAANLNNGLLFITSNGVGGASQVTLIKFNLNTIPYSINKARLTLAVLNGGGGCDGISSDAVSEINVYAVDDTTWTEGAVTFNTKPTRGVLLTDLDQATLPVPGKAYFTDDPTAVPPDNGTFASYLETERSGGTGSNGIAGLWVEVNVGLNQVFFEDDESTGASANCTGANLVPTLQLADSSSPLAIDLANSNVSSVEPNIFMWIGLVLLLVASSLFVIARRKSIS